MRRFSDEQESIIRRINEAGDAGSDLMSLLDPYLCEAGVKVAVTGGTNVELKYPSQMKMGEGTSRCRRIHRLIVGTDSLVCYLKDNGYVIPVVSAVSHISDKDFGRFPEAAGAVVNTPVPWVIPDTTTKKIVLDSLGKALVPTPLLAALIANGFKTDDDIRFARQRQQTWVAIGVAFVVGLASVLLGVWSQFNAKTASREAAAAAAKSSKVETARWDALSAFQGDYLAQLAALRREQARLSDAVAALTNRPPAATNAVATTTTRRPRSR